MSAQNPASGIATALTPVCLTNMTTPRRNPWPKVAALTITMPLVGIAILVLWWRVTFHWEMDYVMPFYWAPLVVFAWCLIASTPLPLLWTIIKAVRRKKTPEVGRSGE